MLIKSVITGYSLLKASCSLFNARRHTNQTCSRSKLIFCQTKLKEGRRCSLAQTLVLFCVYVSDATGLIFGLQNGVAAFLGCFLKMFFGFYRLVSFKKLNCAHHFDQSPYIKGLHLYLHGSHLVFVQSSDSL